MSEELNKEEETTEETEVNQDDLLRQNLEAQAKQLNLSEEFKEDDEEEEETNNKTSSLNNKTEDNKETDDKTSANEIIQAPTALNKEQKEAFRSLSPEQQKRELGIYKSMEADYRRKTAEIAPFRDGLNEIEQYTRSINPELGAVDFIRNMMSLDKALRPGSRFEVSKEEKQEIIKNILIDYDIIPEEYRTELEKQRKLAEQDPRFQEMQRRQVAENENKIKEQERQIYTQYNNWKDSFTSFGTSKDEQGNLKNPYFQYVYNEMGVIAGHLMDQGYTIKSGDWPAIYEKACQMNDDVREHMTKNGGNQQQQTTNQNQQKQPPKKTGFISSSRGGNSKNSKLTDTTDLRGQLQAQAKAMGIFD